MVNDLLNPSLLNTPPELKNFRLSPSSVSTYKQCPKKWEYRYIHKIKEPSGYPAIVGKFMHSVLEELMQLSSEKRTMDKARLLARKIFDEQVTKEEEFIQLNLSKEENTAFLWEAWSSIEGLWSIEDPTKVEVSATEQRLSTKLGGVQFLGFIDRVDNGPQGVSIIDYKSGKFPTSKSYEKEKLNQVYLYAAAYEAINGIKPKEVKIYFTKPMGGNNIDVISGEVTEEATQAVVEDLTKTHSKIQLNAQAENFNQKTGPLCGWCFYIDKCEKGQNYIKNRYTNGTLKNTAPAIKILNLSN